MAYRLRFPAKAGSAPTSPSAVTLSICDERPADRVVGSWTFPSDPTVPLSGLQGWWAADDLALTDGAAVASWVGRFGPTLSEATNRPVFKTGIANGKPCVRFTRASNHVLSSSSGPWLRNTSGATVFLVGKTSIGPGHRTFFVVEKNVVDGDRLSLDAQANTGALEVNGRRLDSDSYTTYVAPTTAPTTPSTMRLVANYNAATISLAVNGTAAGSSSWLTNGRTSDTDSTSIRLGNTAGGLGLDGDIFEVLIYNRVLTAGEITTVESYLQAKYTPSSPAAGQATATGTAAAARSTPGSAAGSVSAAGSADGTVTAGGTTWTASATGAAAAGGAASATRTAQSASAGSVVAAGSAAASLSLAATATGSGTCGGAATALRVAVGAANGSDAAGGTATAAITAATSATSSAATSAAAAGTVSTGGTTWTATATGTAAGSGTGSAVRTASGAASGAATAAGSADGVRTVSAGVTGSTSAAAAAAATRTAPTTATGATAVGGAAAGLRSTTSPGGGTTATAATASGFLTVAAAGNATAAAAGSADALVQPAVTAGTITATWAPTAAMTLAGVNPVRIETVLVSSASAEPAPAMAGSITATAAATATIERS